MYIYTHRLYSDTERERALFNIDLALRERERESQREREREKFICEVRLLCTERIGEEKTENQMGCREREKKDTRNMIIIE